MRDFLVGLQKVDVRWVYLAVALACTIPFLVPMKLSVCATKETRGVFDMIENIPRDKDGNATKVVVIESGWEAWCEGELKGHAQVLVDHLFKNDIPFVIIDLGVSDKAPQFMEKVTDEYTKDHRDKNGKLIRAKYPDKVHGEHWVNLGYCAIGGWQAITIMAKDFHRLYPVDYYNTSTKDAKKLPLMQRVNNINDIYMVITINYSPSEDWVAFCRGVYGTPVAFACSGIQSTVTYRFLPSNQLVGMLVSVRGSAEYDTLLYPKCADDRTTSGTKLIVPLAFGHLVIIAAIIVGNIGYFASRGRRSRT